MRVLSLDATYRIENCTGKMSLSLAGTPHEEECTPAGGDQKDGRLECEALADQLRRLHGKEPEGAEFFIQRNTHDFGVYYELGIFYEETKEREWNEDESGYDEADEEESVSQEYALKCESGIPDLWDAEAKTWLRAQGYTPLQTLRIVLPSADEEDSIIRRAIQTHEDEQQALNY